MSPEKQRVAIATACGWKCAGHPDQILATRGWEFAYQFVIRPTGELVTHNSIPDYLNDLNAMHAAEKVLNQMQSRANAYHLAESEQNETWASCHIWHQTAAQRAEAFLRTLGLWEDAQ